MVEPIAAIVNTTSNMSNMGDKVAAFAIAQNFLWTFATLKGDLDHWIKPKRWFFFFGALGAGAIYALVELLIWRNIRALIMAAGYEPVVCRQILNASVIIFAMLAAGAFASSALAGLAFWGTTREE